MNLVLLPKSNDFFESFSFRFQLVHGMIPVGITNGNTHNDLFRVRYAYLFSKLSWEVYNRPHNASAQTKSLGAKRCCLRNRANIQNGPSSTQHSIKHNNEYCWSIEEPV